MKSNELVDGLRWTSTDRLLQMLSTDQFQFDQRTCMIQHNSDNSKTCMHAQAHIKHGLYITKTENIKWSNRRRDAMTLWKAITKLAGSRSHLDSGAHGQPYGEPHGALRQLPRPRGGSPTVALRICIEGAGSKLGRGTLYSRAHSAR